jgi:hypothetical protein
VFCVGGAAVGWVVRCRGCKSICRWAGLSPVYIHERSMYLATVCGGDSNIIHGAQPIVPEIVAVNVDPSTSGITLVVWIPLAHIVCMYSCVMSMGMTS